MITWLVLRLTFFHAVSPPEYPSTSTSTMPCRVKQAAVGNCAVSTAVRLGRGSCGVDNTEVIAKQTYLVTRSFSSQLLFPEDLFHH